MRTLITLFFFYKNIVFPAQAEYSYFSADFRLKIFLYYSYIIAYDISILELTGVSINKCLVSRSVLNTVHMYYMYRSSNCYQVISVEHFAIASAGFFRFVG